VNIYTLLEDKEMKKFTPLIFAASIISVGVMSCCIHADDHDDRKGRSENRGGEKKEQRHSEDRPRNQERKEQRSSEGGPGRNQERKGPRRDNDGSKGPKQEVRTRSEGQKNFGEHRSYQGQASQRNNGKAREERRRNFQNNIQQGDGNTRGRVQRFLQEHPFRGWQGQQRDSQAWQNRKGDERSSDRSNSYRGWWKYNNTRTEGLARTTRDRFWRNYSDRGQKWFNRNFWASRRYRPAFYNYNYNWWNAASVGALSSWLGWQGRPYYYSYADGYWGPTYYTDSYYSSNDYSDRANLIDSYQSTNQEWLSLGVFALVDTVTSEDPKIYLQLAINKDGFIGGTFYNVSTDQSYDLEGIVQQDSQRAAWKIDSRADSPVFETGIYNLSNSEQPVRLYFPDGSVRNLLMVRLDDSN